MKYCKIILISLFLVSGFFTISCADRGEHIRTFASRESVTVSKYDFIIIENTRYRNDEKFRAYVEDRVKNTGYIRIEYDLVVRLHRTFLIRAWVFYTKKKK